MDNNSGIIGKIVAFIGSFALIIGRCASSGGDDIVRLAARGVDDVAVYSDDVLRYSDEFVQSSDAVILGSKLSAEGSQVHHLDDVLTSVVELGTEAVGDEEEVEPDNIVDAYDLQYIESIYFGFNQLNYTFSDSTRLKFINILRYSKPIEKPISTGKMGILKGNNKMEHYLALFGKDWIGIKEPSEGKYEYYSSKADFTKMFR